LVSGIVHQLAVWEQKKALGKRRLGKEMEVEGQRGGRMHFFLLPVHR
jgi:hypothetical protein